jgi:hypothetical protein
MSAQKLRLQIQFPASMAEATEFARTIVEAAGLDDAMIRYGQIARGNLRDVWGFYIEGRTDDYTAIQSLMTGALKSAKFELKPMSQIMPTVQPKNVWHISI